MHFSCFLYRTRYPVGTKKEDNLSRMEHMFRRSSLRGACRPDGCHGEAEPVPGRCDGQRKGSGGQMYRLKYSNSMGKESLCLKLEGLSTMVE